MPADEHKTLLKVEGDAEGAKRAAQETKKAVTDVSGASSVASQANEETAASSKRAADATKEFAQREAQAAADANAFSEAVSTVSPELGLMTRLAIKAKEVLRFMFSPVGLAATAAAGAIALVIARLNQATAAAEAFREAQERIKRGTIELERSIAEALGQFGKGTGEAVGAARQIARRAEEEGFDPAAARRVAAAVVDRQGVQKVSDEELYRLIAYVQTGVGDLGGHTPREQERSLRRALRAIERQPRYFDEAIGMFTWHRRGERRRAESFDRQAIESFLREQEKLQGEALEKAAQEMVDFQTKGGLERSTAWAGFAGLGDWLMEYTPGLQYAGVRSPTQIREMVAQDRLRRLAVWSRRVSRAPAATASPAGVPSPSPSDVPGPSDVMPAPASASGISPEAQRQLDAMAQKIDKATEAMLRAGGIRLDGDAQPAQQTIFSHGPIYLQRPPRGGRVQRGLNP